MSLDRHTLPGALLASLVRQNSGPEGRHLEAQADIFNSLINHLALLQSNGTINNRMFSDLTRDAAALFVEEEVTARLNQVMDEGLAGLYSVNE
ncbi:MAG: hypothetical protein OXF42_01690 [Candidatus Dadabacteria bacterium]|nr:hypothetical protein [Candidatus Dadabacteria bacterium]